MRHCRSLRVLLAGLITSIALMGCASAPSGPLFPEIALPDPPAGKAVIVVLRDHAEPRKYAATVAIDRAPLFKLPQSSFAYALVDPGERSLGVRWPAVAKSWKGDVAWQAGTTHFYELSAVAGHGFHTSSALTRIDEGLARAMLGSCCRLISELAGSVTKAHDPPIAVAPRAVNVKTVRLGMNRDEVIAAIGTPRSVRSTASEKAGSLFYFGSDTRRVVWSYADSGSIVFSRNEYSGALNVVGIVPGPNTTK